MGWKTLSCASIGLWLLVGLVSAAGQNATGGGVVSNSTDGNTTKILTSTTPELKKSPQPSTPTTVTTVRPATQGKTRPAVRKAKGEDIPQTRSPLVQVLVLGGVLAGLGMLATLANRLRSRETDTAAALQGPVYYRPEKEQDEDSVEAEDTRLPPATGTAISAESSGADFGTEELAGLTEISDSSAAVGTTTTGKQ